MVERSEREKIAHVLRRFGLGASQTELQHFAGLGLQKTIDRLLDYDQTDEGFPLTLQDFANQRGQINLRSVQAYWMLRLLVTQRPLQEKLTIFWHHHFATSAQKVDVPPAMAAQIELLRAGATGGFQDLLLNVSKDPAMLYWLDNQFNVKGRPNENFAREVMELFTLGIGHYSEKDVQEAARAFTGWTYRAGLRAQEKPGRVSRFYFREDLHDDGGKTVMGRTGNWNGDDVVDLLCKDPQTARFMVTKFWTWFAYAKPEPALVDRIADGWRKADLSIKWLARAVMESEEFYSDRAFRKQIKNPIDYCVSTLRQLGVGQPLVERVRAAEDDSQKIRSLGALGVLRTTTASMGMELLAPPDVSGWPTGTDWISSATMVERIKWADRLFGRPTRGQPTLNLPGTALIGVFGPTQTTERVCAVFDADLPQPKKDQMIVAAEKAATPQEGIHAVTRLLFATPEFQFC